MGEPDPVAFDDDDALPLCGFEELDQPVMVDCGRLADQLDRRLGQACSGKQHVVNLGLEAAILARTKSASVSGSISSTLSTNARANSMA